MSNAIQIVVDDELHQVTGGHMPEHFHPHVFEGLVNKWAKEGGAPGNWWGAIQHINNQGNLLGQSMGADRAASWLRGVIEGK